MRFQPTSEPATVVVLVDHDVIAAVVFVDGGVDLVVTNDDVCERRRSDARLRTPCEQTNRLLMRVMSVTFKSLQQDVHFAVRDIKLKVKFSHILLRLENETTALPFLLA